MEAARTRRTDDRLDDLAQRVSLHDAWVVEVGGLQESGQRVEGELSRIRADISEMRRWIVNLWATLGLGLLGLLVEIGMR